MKRLKGEEHSVAAGAPVGGGANAPVQAMTFTRWMSMCLDTFDGSGTPTDAADWLCKMEKVMAACRMTAEGMVLFVPHQLTSQPDIWWVGVCDAWTPTRGAITWEVFLAQFRAKYYPDSFRDKMNDVLNHIQQGEKTVDEYERDFSNIVRFVPSVASDEREKARKFFTGLNARYREVMGRNPPTTYITEVEEAMGIETQFQLTVLQQRHNGNSSNTGGEHKRVHQEGGEPSQQPSFKKSKGNQPSRQPSKSKQSGAQSFSGQHGGNSSFMRPVPGQGLICFKCGKSHRASDCGFSGTCNTCGKEGHINMVCKRNPNCIIKWQHSGSSSAGSTSVASSRGSAPTVAAPRGTVQMMDGPPPAPYSSCPHYYYPPSSYYWPPPQLPTPSAPL
ncbi:hypothetical protein PVAP13_3NG143708 [Panicum virgatum]|uniref:CCHC-type domain-containing protein n=1 Tax=Panicum virgatum TaxID=38727 RepID=A0A8T0UCV9_PANVG|nr:hypothetical protein PVAP13_3NG143708 [Panicum virgatum]